MGPCAGSAKRERAQFDALLPERRRLFGSEAGMATPVAIDVVCVRVLETLVDGASAAASDGFFDHADLPPWLLWLDVRAGDDGVRLVNATDCISLGHLGG